MFLQPGVTSFTGSLPPTVLLNCWPTQTHYLITTGPAAHHLIASISATLPAGIVAIICIIYWYDFLSMKNESSCYIIVIMAIFVAHLQPLDVEKPQCLRIQGQNSQFEMYFENLLIQ